MLVTLASYNRRLKNCRSKRDIRDCSSNETRGQAIGYISNFKILALRCFVQHVDCLSMCSYGHGHGHGYGYGNKLAKV